MQVIRSLVDEEVSREFLPTASTKMRTGPYRTEMSVLEVGFRAQHQGLANTNFFGSLKPFGIGAETPP